MSTTITIVIALGIAAWGWIISEIYKSKPAVFEQHFEVNKDGDLVEITETIIEVS